MLKTHVAFRTRWQDSAHRKQAVQDLAEMAAKQGNRQFILLTPLEVGHLKFVTARFQSHMDLISVDGLQQTQRR